VLSAFVKCQKDPIGDYVHVSEMDLEIINDFPSLRIRFENHLVSKKKEEVENQ